MIRPPMLLPDMNILQWLFPAIEIMLSYFGIDCSFDFASTDDEIISGEDDIVLLTPADPYKS
jgi:hypothetical protein